MSLITSNFQNLKFYLNRVEANVEGLVEIDLNVKNKSTVKLSGVYLKDSDPTKPFFILDYSKLLIIDFVENEVIFEGIVKMSSYAEITNYESFKGLSILATDYKDFLSSIDPIYQVVENSSPAQVVEDIISKFLNKYNFGLGNLEFNSNAPELIKHWNINGMRPFNVFEWIAAYTNSDWKVRVVDQVLRIDFFTIKTPKKTEFPLWINNGIYGVAQEPFGPGVGMWDGDGVKKRLREYGIYKIEYQSARSVDYANKVIVRSDFIVADKTKQMIFISTGEANEQFGVPDSYKIYKIDKQLNGTTSWSNQVFLHKKYEDDGQPADFFVDNISAKVSKSNKLVKGDKIRIEYYEAYKSQYTAVSSDEQKRIQSNLGIKEVSRVMDYQKNDIHQQADLVAYAEGLLEKYATPYRPLKFYSHMALSLDSINLGDTINIVPFNNNEIKSPVFTTYLVSNLKIKANKTWYETEATLIPTLNSNQAINFYDERFPNDYDDSQKEIEIQSDTTFDVKYLISHSEQSGEYEYHWYTLEVKNELGLIYKIEPGKYKNKIRLEVKMEVKN